MTVVILGAGPAGITAARMLTKEGVDVVVIDRNAFVGGAAASQSIGDGSAKMDFGPHAFHLKNPDVNKVFLDHVGDECPTKTRNERLLVRGGLFNYPLQIWDVLSHLSPGHILYMGSAFAVARLRRFIIPPEDKDFEAWGVHRYGRPLYEFTCGQYSEKVWGVRGSELSAKLAQQKLKDLRLRDIAKKLLGGTGEEHKDYWDDYVYPEKGMGTVFENMAECVNNSSGEVILSSTLSRVWSDGQKVTKISVENEDGNETEYSCDALINTIPLTYLASALDAGNSSIRIESAHDLKYRGLILINIVFKKSQIMPYDWVYLLDPVFKCNRFTEQKNMGGKMIPKDKTILCFELSANPGDTFWESDDELLFKVALSDIEKIDFFNESDIETFHISRMSEAYPMYDLNFNKQLENVIESLSKTKNLYTVGRHGLFLNNDIHDSMEMGIKISTNLLEKEDVVSWYNFALGYVRGKINRTRI